MKSFQIAIIDYGMGNLNSIKKSLNCLGINTIITSDPKTIASANRLILPGVGHFKKAFDNLKQLNLCDVLNETVLVKKKPVLGICLGMQLMAKHSEEGDAKGFGWFDADVIKFNIDDKLKFKVPHIGWNSIIKMRESKLMNKLTDLSEFYFVHSYHFKCYSLKDILNETKYESFFTSAVEKDNIFGVQYHPEKSHDAGELLLKNFAEI
jgi:glutamine amidotransferase